MKAFGVDISKWQGNFDIAKAVKNDGVEFVIIKGGGGDVGLYRDSRFAENYTKAKAAGIPVGCYWFSKALSVDDAKSEAEYFYKACLKGRQFELPVYIDVEHAAQLALGKEKLTEIVLAWLNAVHDKGYYVGIYSSTSYFQSYMDDSKLQKYAHWVAQWSTECTYKGNPGVLGMWQFGGEYNKLRSTQIAGKTVDQNYLLVDYQTKIKEKRLNGFQTAQGGAGTAQTVKPTGNTAATVYTVQKGDTLSKIAFEYGVTVDEIAKYNGISNPNLIHPGQKIKIPVALKPLSEIAKEVIQGKWGNGAERKKRLTDAGYDYDDVQARVAVLLK